MNLIETNVLPSASLPIAKFKDYLRLGSGFADDNAQDSVLETCLRAAMGAIEARTAKALISRTFQWKCYKFRLLGNAAILPISPVTWLISIDVTDSKGAQEFYSRNDFIIRPDAHYEHLMPKSGRLPEIPEGGVCTMALTVGYGTWAQVPAALQQAMLMLAASYYENRDALLNGGGQMPLAVATLLVPFQRMRLGVGA